MKMKCGCVWRNVWHVGEIAVKLETGFCLKIK